MTNHGVIEEDTRDKDRSRNLVLNEVKPLYSVQTLDNNDDGIGYGKKRSSHNLK
jgi:hypothetical protein